MSASHTRAARVGLASALAVALWGGALVLFCREPAAAERGAASRIPMLSDPRDRVRVGRVFEGPHNALFRCAGGSRKGTRTHPTPNLTRSDTFSAPAKATKRKKRDKGRGETFPDDTFCLGNQGGYVTTDPEQFLRGSRRFESAASARRPGRAQTGRFSVLPRAKTYARAGAVVRETGGQFLGAAGEKRKLLRLDSADHLAAPGPGQRLRLASTTRHEEVSAAWWDVQDSSLGPAGGPLSPGRFHGAHSSTWGGGTATL